MRDENLQRTVERLRKRAEGCPPSEGTDCALAAVDALAGLVLDVEDYRACASGHFLAAVRGWQEHVRNKDEVHAVLASEADKPPAEQRCPSACNATRTLLRLLDVVELYDEQEVVRRGYEGAFSLLLLVGYNTAAAYLQRLLRDSPGGLLEREPGVLSRPDVQGGVPCVAGTRVTVDALLSFRSAGHSVEEIRAEYPHLSPDDVRYALNWADVNGYPPERVARCTGLTATWCPVHGDCTCPFVNDDEDQGRTMDSEDCPLHGVESSHAEPLPWDEEDQALADASSPRDAVACASAGAAEAHALWLKQLRAYEAHRSAATEAVRDSACNVLLKELSRTRLAGEQDVRRDQWEDDCKTVERALDGCGVNTYAGEVLDDLLQRLRTEGKKFAAGTGARTPSKGGGS